MAEEKLLTIREVSLILGISEKEVIDLSEDGSIPAYKVGGVYLRFKKEQIEEFKKSFKQLPFKTPINGKTTLYSADFSPKRSSFKERLSDFLYLNDFYILSFLLIVLILLIILRGY